MLKNFSELEQES